MISYKIRRCASLDATETIVRIAWDQKTRAARGGAALRLFAEAIEGNVERTEFSGPGGVKVAVDGEGRSVGRGCAGWRGWVRPG